MKFCVLYLLLSITVHGAFAQSKKDTIIQGLHFNQVDTNIGPMKQGPNLEVFYKFKNLNPFPVQILHIRSGDPHYAHKWSREPIMPNETSSIGVIMQTRYRVGNNRKCVTVQFADSLEPIRLCFHGQIYLDSARDMRCRVNGMNNVNFLDINLNRLKKIKEDIVYDLTFSNKSVNSLVLYFKHVYPSYDSSLKNIVRMEPSQVMTFGGEDVKFKMIVSHDSIQKYRKEIENQVPPPLNSFRFLAKFPHRKDNPRGDQSAGKDLHIHFKKMELPLNYKKDYR